MADDPSTPPQRPIKPPQGGPYAPRSGIPGAPTPQRTPRPPREVDPKLAEQGQRRLLHFAFLMLVGLLSSNLPLPWQILASLAYIAALVTGIRALISLWKAQVRGIALPMAIVGLIISGVLLATSLSLLALWPIQMERQDCLRRAVTISSEEQCEQDFEDSLKDLLNTDDISNPFTQLLGTQ